MKDHTMTIWERVVEMRYLGCVIQGSGDIDEDVTHRDGVAWMKWRLASESLDRPCCMERVLAVQGRHVQKLHVAEMRMLRWMCGHTRSDKIRNEVIREKVGVASVVDKLREVRQMVWTCEEAGAAPRRGRGRPKKYWGEVIRQDLVQLHLTEDMTLDRKEWRSRIKVEVFCKFQMKNQELKSQKKIIACSLDDMDEV
ncbi:hypothetical protein H5410_000735 [Solanum commersonii]|uniref:Uncharacterized protein n=1 Tax=Solanum commersonii TaxID=4109 RepID=A0A9J6AXL6_SOLCO|nr:hypothetical protein H5410_000735 [Solanum commersonii]